MNHIVLIVAALLLPSPGLASGLDQLPMKLDYAEGTIMKSASAQRILAGDNAEARAKLEEAQTLYRQARTAQQEGDFARAETLITSALRAMTHAARLAPDRSSIEQQQKQRHTELLQQAEAFLSWGKALADKEPAMAQEIRQDATRVTEAVEHARTLASAGKLGEANETLSHVLSQALNKTGQALGSRTFTYDLNFATPIDEYRYELERNRDFERLIPIAITQRGPSAGIRNLMNTYVEHAIRLRHDAESLFEEKRYTEAITSLKDSTAEFERALRTAGVR